MRQIIDLRDSRIQFADSGLIGRGTGRYDIEILMPLSQTGAIYWDTVITAYWDTVMTAYWDTPMSEEI